MLKVLPYAIIPIMIVLGALVYVGLSGHNRRLERKRALDAIEIEKQQTLADIEIENARRQNTWSLEDLEKTRRHINAQIEAARELERGES